MEDDLRVEALLAALHEAEAEVEAVPKDVDQLVHHDEAGRTAHHPDVEATKPEILAPSAWDSHTDSDATTRCPKA